MTENIQHLPHCVLHHLIKPTKLRRRSHIYYTYIQIQTNVRMNNMRFDDKHQTISTQYTEKKLCIYIYMHLTVLNFHVILLFLVLSNSNNAFFALVSIGKNASEHSHF